MTSAKLRVNDVKCPFAPLKPLPDEWQQDSIFLIPVVEECANVLILGQRCPCKTNGVRRFCIGFSHLCPLCLGLPRPTRVFYSRVLLGSNPFCNALVASRHKPNRRPGDRLLKSSTPQRMHVPRMHVPRHVPCSARYAQFKPPSWSRSDSPCREIDQPPSSHHLLDEAQRRNSLRGFGRGARWAASLGSWRGGCKRRWPDARGPGESGPTEPDGKAVMKSTKEFPSWRKARSLA